MTEPERERGRGERRVSGKIAEKEDEGGRKSSSAAAASNIKSTLWADRSEGRRDERGYNHIITEKVRIISRSRSSAPPERLYSDHMPR